MAKSYKIVKSIRTFSPNRLSILLCMFMITAGFYSCKKFVLVQPPPALLLSETVYADSSTTVAAINGLYIQVRDNGPMNGSINNQMNLCADELMSYSTSLTARELLYRNAILPTTSGLSSYWSATYSQIYAANAIIEGVNKSSSISTTFKNQIRGEALFIRGLLHFYLVNLFGDVPYADTTDYLINTHRFRLSQPDVYAKILADIHESESLLSDDYPSAERVRVNKWVAKALLARIYLYIKNWEQAAALAGEVIDHSDVYQLENQLDKVFLKESTEAIWQFKPIEGSNTVEANIAILSSSPVPSRQSLSAHLMNAFESGDERRIYWVGQFSRGSQTWYYPYKYKQRFPTSGSMEYSIIFRLSEQYLIRAEALAQLNNVGAALPDINLIRVRAGLPEIEVIPKEEFLEIVYHERQVELFFEFSHRWFDLKRTGRANAVLGIVKPGWNATDTLLPVPESELRVNSNLLPQNPGFN